MSELRKCKVLGVEFEISDKDILFYKKVGVPLPTICPEERERKRLIWRNERHLYKRVCGLCGKNILAIYPEECEFPIYCDQCFWSDKWNCLSYGRDFDFNRPFFEQFNDLAKVVPRLAITHNQCVNSDYTVNCTKNKNCYLISGGDYNEDCLYALNIHNCKNCVDNYLIYDSELCYGCFDSSKAYNCIGCQECENIQDSCFLFDCKSCRHCAFSWNLRNKEYVFFNQQLDKDAYEKKLQPVLNEIFSDFDWINSNRTKVREKAICRDCLIINSENSSGNNVRNCKNAHMVFDTTDAEDSKFVYYSLSIKDVYDCSCVGYKCSVLYEIMSATTAYNCFFCNALFDTSNARYCIAAFNNCSDLFGCISTNHNQYVILNKQYERSEYFEMVKRLITHMRTTGEYGKFFPEYIAPFEYNRSAAFDYMPLTKEGVLGRGLRWYEGSEQVAQAPSDTELKCKDCGKNYRIILQEAEFYKRMKIPETGLCWGCRIKRLIASRRPKKLFKNSCKKCGAPVQSPFGSERLETVYCEKCYLETVY